MWFKKQPTEPPLIHNKRPPVKRRDFNINFVGIAILVAASAAALAIRLAVGVAPSAIEFAVLLAAPIATIALLALWPRWSIAVKLLLILAAGLAAWRISELPFILVFAAAGILLVPAIQKTDEWERAIVLRFGRFFGVRGPGLFWLFPFADRVAETVDLRIRVTDFSAETTLTKDSVTVTVDALCFWLVWDAEKAVCEVENYEEAVVLSSKTALRSAVSQHDLSVFLERGDDIEARIRADVDKKSTEWGITVQHIEITDIQIPDELQNNLSRLAQAEREKKSRILLAEAEIDVARRFEEAAKIYDANPTTMKLKSLSILNEGLKAGNSMMLIPSDLSEELKSSDLFGLQALHETRRHAAKEADYDGRKNP